MSDPLDFVTVLTTKGPPATKRITWGRAGLVIEPYGRAAFFGIQEYAVSGIGDLASLLDWVETQDAPRDPAKHAEDYIEIRIADLDPLIDAITELQSVKEAEAVNCEPTYPAPLGSVEDARAAMIAEMQRFRRRCARLPQRNRALSRVRTIR